MEVAAKIGTGLALSGLSPVVNKLASHFGGDVTLEEMEHLNAFVAYEIEALIRQAKSEDLVKSATLLEKLQAAALELDDLLDLYQYNQIEKQVISSSSSNPIKKLKPIFKEGLRPILPKSSLRIGLEKLLKFVEQVEKIHPFITSRTDIQPLPNPVTSKTSTQSSPFYGRTDQYDLIIKLLLDESHTDLNSKTEKVPITAIRGLGGAGKTTIAQHLYNENKIVDYFDLRMWVHVARDFNEHILIKETIESAEKNSCPQISNLDVLQTKLKNSVLKRKFLLVLDDVWEEDTTKLDIVLSPLNQIGVKGSKIIVTTRTEKAAKNVNAKPIILLDELKDEDCWSILKYYAFDGNEEIIEDHHELKNVGNQIIKKVKHSPLALKVVGSSLRNKRSVNEWDKILHQDILKETMDLLLFSYQCLPLHLQRCFAYCSLFPKGYNFNSYNLNWEPQLISLWIAQGFIENKHESTLEKEGQKYIEELLSFSFFEKSEYDFVIHDLLHDLAEMVSKKQCYRIDQYYDPLNVPTTCIHLSLCMMAGICQPTILTSNLKNLRSLIILESAGYMNIFESKKDIFQNLTKLRALFVVNQQMEVLHYPHIYKLKHLRYLHVSYNNKLPASLVKLYQLQFLILNTDQKLSETHLPANTLPMGFSNLTNLRVLRFCNNFRIGVDYLYYNSKMANIEKLALLQNLDKFHVDGFNGIKSLRDLPISGSLSILNLENVKDKEEAEEAMLNHKKNIDDLSFEWNGASSSIGTCEEVLEGLEPHRNLEQLAIKGYQGVKFPRWMVKENWLPRLQTLTLKSCRSLKIVLFLPPRLHQLYVCDCEELMQLPPLSDTLLTISLTGCPMLQALTNLSPTVADLTVEDCPNLMLPSSSIKSPSLCDLSVLTNLKWLRLKGILNLQVLTNLSPTVTRLTIEDCPNLLQPSEAFSLCDLSNLTHLKFSTLKGIPNLQVLANLSPTVTNLDIEDCSNLPLPSMFNKSSSLCDLSVLTNLERLRLKGISNLQVLTNLSPTVTFLDIVDCPKLTSVGNLQCCTSLRWLTIVRSPLLKREEASLVEGAVEGDIANHFPQIGRITTDDLLLVLELVQQQAFSSITFLTLTGYLTGCAVLPNLEKISSLGYLIICYSPDVESLPNLPISLGHLGIIGCPKLKEKYEEGGPLRNTISHLPDIRIP